MRMTLAVGTVPVCSFQIKACSDKKLKGILPSLTFRLP